MENKHTPGPWKIIYPEGFLYHIVINGRPFIATIDGQYPDLEQCEEHEQENLANAKLIAAAPELLEALRAIAEELPDPTLSVTKIIKEIAESAIKKATL